MKADAEIRVVIVSRGSNISTPMARVVAACLQVLSLGGEEEGLFMRFI